MFTKALEDIFRTVADSPVLVLVLLAACGLLLTGRKLGRKW